MSPVVSLPCLTLKESLDHLDELRIPSMNASPRKRRSSGYVDNNVGEDEDYVRIPKKEYEAIKNRVSAIEKRISREFELIQPTPASELSAHHQHPLTSDVVMSSSTASPPIIANVQDKYERALVETEEMNRSIGGTDELAKRLGRDLKIRRSVDHKIIRSPSARKIGSIRRRSRDNNSKLNRTKSLNVTTTSGRKTTLRSDDEDALGEFYPRQSSNLRRGRPNTILTGLRVNKSPTEGRRLNGVDTAMTMRRSSTVGTGIAPPKPVPSLNEFYPGASVNAVGNDEVWTDAKDFFSQSRQPPVNITNVTPKRTEANERRGSLRSAGKVVVDMVGVAGSPKPNLPNPEDNLLKTPMLPPKRTAPRKTPGSSVAKNHYLTPLQQVQQTGRASIARIRSQNAGMVLAKARLFNDLEEGDKAPALEVRRVTTAVPQKENQEVPKTFVSSFRKPQIKPVLMANSPRRIVKTPSRERATPVRALPRSPAQAVVGSRMNAARQF